MPELRQLLLPLVALVLPQAVQAKTAQRVIDVGRITGQQHAARAELVGHALVYTVNALVHDGVSRIKGCSGAGHRSGGQHNVCRCATARMSASRATEAWRDARSCGSLEIRTLAAA